MNVRFYNEFNELIATKRIDCIPPKGTVVFVNNRAKIVQYVMFYLETCEYVVFLKDA